MTKLHRDPKEKATEIPAELTVDQAIELAKGLQQRLALDEAETIYRRVLTHMPEHPDALHFLGLLQHQRSRPEEAIRLISKALRVAPEYADAHNNLGNIYREQERLNEAETCYRRVIELTPLNAGAFNNLGTVLRAKGLLGEAGAAYQKAIDLEPNFPNPFENLGNLLSRQGRVAEAVAHYSQAIVLNPDHPGCKKMLGIALSCIGKIEEAANVFREWTEKEPDNPVAHHLLAACSGKDVPQRADDAYVKQVFDNFAERFEERLEILEYQAPELVSRAVAQIYPEAAADLDFLDAGCGTGLCGPLLRPYARRLEGVDLSPGMLDRAKTTGCYDALEEAELTGFIGSRKDAYDVIVSADTLCYFGDLQAVMDVVAAALRPGGFFIFTVERYEEDDGTLAAGFRINPLGRYSHQESYVGRTIAEAGLQIHSVAHGTLRQEMGAPVAGLVVTAAVDGVKKDA
jgi:predicted TPR repeat methyltransferase